MVLFIMMSIFSICHTQMFYLVQIVFILLVSIYVNIPYIHSVFNDIFYANNTTNIFDNNLYITGLLNRDNNFLDCNCKVTGESITLFQQEKFKGYKIFITLENNSIFLYYNFYYF